MLTRRELLTQATPGAVALGSAGFSAAFGALAGEVRVTIRQWPSPAHQISAKAAAHSDDGAPAAARNAVRGIQ